MKGYMFTQKEKETIVQALKAYKCDTKVISNIIKKLEPDSYRNTVKKIIYTVMKNNQDNQEAYEKIYQIYQDFKNFKINDGEALEMVDKALRVS